MCFQKCSLLVDNFALLFDLLSNRLNQDQMVLMAVMARKIWFRRNALIFEGKFAHPKSIMEEATKACEEFIQLNSTQPTQSRPAGGDNASWHPPPQHVVKLNWDASIHKASGSIGFGCVARDHLRNFLGAKVSHQQILVNPKMVEAMSAHHAVIFVKEVGFASVIFEGDALQVIQALSAAPPHLHSIGHFVENIHHDMESFQFVSFEANGVAHSLAKAIVSQCLDTRWLESPPSLICTQLFRDLCNP
jgi:hypothetical protein